MGPLHDRLVANRPRRFQVVLGHRRVGKTTAMYHVVNRLLAGGVAPRRLWWHRLDHPLLMELPLGDLVRVTLDLSDATMARPAVILLDEVVYARDWDLWLKTFHDEQWPLRLVATSSATAALRERRTESGVGRWEEQYLPPYLLAEYLQLRQEPAELPLGGTLTDSLRDAIASPPDLAIAQRRARELLVMGGFPELLVDLAGHDDEQSALLESQRTLRSDAVERAIYKDIPQSFGIESPLHLERVLYVLAGQLTGMLSPTNIARDLGLSQPTIDRYISHLEQAFLVFVLPNYSGSETTTQRRGRKIYFVDGAVRNAALQRGTAPLGDDVEMGTLRENMAASHLAALARHTQARLFHWRAGGHEVDLVYDHPDTPLAFEIGSSPDHSRQGLQAFVEKFPRFAGRTYLVAPNAPPVRATASTHGSIPLALFLWVVSAQADGAARERLAAGIDSAQPPLF